VQVTGLFAKLDCRHLCFTQAMGHCFCKVVLVMLQVLQVGPVTCMLEALAALGTSLTVQSLLLPRCPNVPAQHVAGFSLLSKPSACKLAGSRSIGCVNQQGTP
jgi:hypothetical protein